MQACWKAVSKLNGGTSTAPASLHTPQISVFMGLYLHVLGVHMISIATLVMKLLYIVEFTYNGVTKDQPAGVN